MMRDLTGKAVLITGAASGIGRSTAFAFAKQGAVLFLADIDARGVERTAMLCEKLGARVEAHRVDVADRQQLRDLADHVHSRVPALDVLVNNAGVGVAGNFVETPMEVWDWAVSINLQAVIHGCHLFAPPMIERGRGGSVVNVASLAGLVASKRMSVYCTTKHAVVGFSDSLREDLAPAGISVAAICPGIINTPITRNARLLGELDASEHRARMSAFYRKRAYGPHRVAAAIVDAVRQGKGMVPVAPESWLLYYLKRAAPALAIKLASAN